VVAALFVASLAAGATVTWPTLEMASEWLGATPSRLESIEVQGNKRLTPEAVAAATGVAKGSPIREIDLREVERRLTGHAWIRSATATRLPTGQLLVLIDEREPGAALRESAADSWQLIDRDGTPFTTARSQDLAYLPRLSSDRKFEEGLSDPLLERALVLASEINRLELPRLAGPAELRLPAEESTEGWILELRDHSLRVVLGAGEVEQNLKYLAQLLTSRLEEVRQAKQIDLRFSNRAVLKAASAS
jgi:cell division septal protein FtsQ